MTTREAYREALDTLAAQIESEIDRYSGDPLSAEYMAGDLRRLAFHLRGTAEHDTSAQGFAAEIAYAYAAAVEGEAYGRLFGRAVNRAIWMVRNDPGGAA